MKSFLLEKQETPVQLSDREIDLVAGGYDGEIVRTPGGSTGTMYSTPDVRGIHTDD